ncbi:MAG: GDSL-type esterase/lipase family protein [Wujia sp.]
MKKRYLILTTLLVVFASLFASWTLYAASKTANTIPTMTEEISMYRGESRYVYITNLGGKSKCSVTSNNKYVATIDNKYKITARHCGNAVLKFRFTRLDQVKDVHVTVRVKESGYLKSKDHGKKTIKKASTKTAAALCLDKSMTPGSNGRMHISGRIKTDKVRFVSSRPSVVSIDANGYYKANSYGNAKLSAYVKRGKVTYTFVLNIFVEDQPQPREVSQTEVDNFFRNSCFIGNSVSVGLGMYFNRQPAGFLGGTTVFARSSYSFYNDLINNQEYLPHLKGAGYQAKTLVSLTGVSKVFVNMGTNDCFGDATEIYGNYVAYVEEIQRVNPNVQIFIQSMTPVHRTCTRTYLNNANINRLNEMLAEYAKGKENIYFIDISTAMKGTDGTLKQEYSSDNYVHLTFPAYECWTNSVVDYAKALIRKEQIAKDAVTTVEGTKTMGDYKNAKNLVNALDASTLKRSLNTRLQKISKKIK